MAFPAIVKLGDIAAGKGGFLIQGENSDDLAGWSVSAADVNDDGISDLIVGAPGNDSGGYHAGAAYVVFGTPGRSRGLVDLDADALRNDGFKIQGEYEGDFAGFSVSMAGDINDDDVYDRVGRSVQPQ